MDDKGECEEADRLSGKQQRYRVQPTDLYPLYRFQVYFLVATLIAAQNTIRSQTGESKVAAGARNRGAEETINWSLNSIAALEDCNTITARM